MVWNIGQLSYGIVAVLLLFSLALSGCSQPSATNTIPSNSNPVVTEPPTVKESKYPFPVAVTPLGDGKIVIDTPSGTSEGGSVPVLFVNRGTVSKQIGADFTNWVGDKEVFLYIDKVFLVTKQVGERSQSTLTLKNEALKTGIHTVSAIQFENNNPIAKAIGYQETTFEIKPESWGPYNVQ